MKKKLFVKREKKLCWDTNFFCQVTIFFRRATIFFVARQLFFVETKKFFVRRHFFVERQHIFCRSSLINASFITLQSLRKPCFSKVHFCDTLFKCTRVPGNHRMSSFETSFFSAKQKIVLFQNFEYCSF